jgi:hypothetical protein
VEVGNLEITVPGFRASLTAFSKAAAARSGLSSARRIRPRRRWKGASSASSAMAFSISASASVSFPSRTSTRARLKGMAATCGRSAETSR